MRRGYYRDPGLSIFSYCGCMVLFLIFNATAGFISVGYLMSTLADKTLPFWGQFLIGLIAGEITVPLALVVWILEICGVKIG